MTFGEVIAFGAFKTEHANDLPFPRQGHDELGQCFTVNVQVARIVRHITDT